MIETISRSCYPNHHAPGGPSCPPVLKDQHHAWVTLFQSNDGFWWQRWRWHQPAQGRQSIVWNHGNHDAWVGAWVNTLGLGLLLWHLGEGWFHPAQEEVVAHTSSIQGRWSRGTLMWKSWYLFNSVSALVSFVFFFGVVGGLGTSLTSSCEVPRFKFVIRYAKKDAIQELEADKLTHRIYFSASFKREYVCSWSKMNLCTEMEQLPNYEFLTDFLAQFADCLPAEASMKDMFSS